MNYPMTLNINNKFVLFLMLLILMLLIRTDHPIISEGDEQTEYKKDARDVSR